MEIRIKNTGAVVTESEFRAMFPRTGFPVQLTEAIINDFGGEVVFEGPQASGGTVYQYSMRQGIEQVNGKWYTKHILGPVFKDMPATATEPAKTAAQQEAEYKAAKDAEQAKNVRAQRDELLSATDWRFRTDMNPSQAWKDYCQALRDVPSQAGFPWSVTWPEKP